MEPLPEAYRWVDGRSERPNERQKGKEETLLLRNPGKPFANSRMRLAEGFFLPYNRVEHQILLSRKSAEIRHDPPQ